MLMGKVIIAGGAGPEPGSDECTATRAEVLTGYTAVTGDSDDEAVEGTLQLTGDAADSQVLAGKTYYNTNPKIKRTGSMVMQGAISQTLNAGESYVVPSGYHNGSGKVMANSLASQTPGNATAASIINGDTAWVNGNKINGNIATMGSQSIIPTASQQVVSTSGKYLTGNITVNGVSNLAAANIKKGVNVGGIVGTFQGYVPTASDLYLRGTTYSAVGAWTYWESNASIDSGQITIKKDSSSQASSVYGICTYKPINLTGYNYVNVEFTADPVDPSVEVYLGLLSSSKYNPLPTGYAIKTSGQFGVVANKVISLPVASYQANTYYIHFGAMYYYLKSYRLAVYRMWLS